MLATSSNTRGITPVSTRTRTYKSPVQRQGARSARLLDTRCTYAQASKGQKDSCVRDGNSQHAGSSALKQAACSLMAAAAMTTSVAMPVHATELDILGASPPAAGSTCIIDDGKLFSKSGVGAVQGLCGKLEKKTGYHLDVVTIRKLALVNDPFDFADKVIERWYPTAEEGDKHGVLLVVGKTKDAALVGGPGFMGKVGNELLSDILQTNVAVYAKEEKWNALAETTYRRLSDALQGAPDKGGPAVKQSCPQRQAFC